MSQRAKAKLRRQWQLVQFISEHNGVTLRHIQKEFRGSRATTYRDLAELIEAGIPVEKHERNGEIRYHVQGVHLPQLRRDAKSAALAAIADQMLLPFAGSSGHEQWQRDQTLMKNGRPAPGRQLAKARAAESAPENIRKLENAIDGKQQIEIRYRKSGKAAQTRIVEPYALRLSKDLYCIAHDIERGELRTFKTSRIERISYLKERQSNYSEETIQNTFAKSRGIWLGPEEEFAIHLDSDVAHLIEEWPLHEDQTLQHHKDGSITVRATLSGEEEALRWALSWAGKAEIIEPQALRQRACDMHEKAAAAHAKAVG